MSYDICLKAKVKGTNKYVTVAEPECCSLGELIDEKMQRM